MWKISRDKVKTARSKLEKTSCGAFTPAIEVYNRTRPTSPLILCSPHSGRHYPDSFRSQTKLSLEQLRLGEDGYIDQLTLPFAAQGIPVLHANFPRCFVDVNRAADEIPPEFMGDNNPSYNTTPRARAGLGVVPKRIAQHQDIYAHNLTPRQVRNRLEHCYHPYHMALQGLLKRSKRRFGQALLLDCHSMPGRAPNGDKRPDIILGDRYGKSCHAASINLLESTFATLGYSVARNYPYAGGYVTQHYGRPARGIETLQIEINKDLYLNPSSFEPHAGFEVLKSNFEKVIFQFLENTGSETDIAAQ